MWTVLSNFIQVSFSCFIFLFLSVSLIERSNYLCFTFFIFFVIFSIFLIFFIQRGLSFNMICGKYGSPCTYLNIWIMMDFLPTDQSLKYILNYISLLTWSPYCLIRNAVPILAKFWKNPTLNCVADFLPLTVCDRRMV